MARRKLAIRARDAKKARTTPTPPRNRAAIASVSMVGNAAAMPWWAEFDAWSDEARRDGELPPGFLEAFSSSMPARYRVLFDPRTTRKHAAICFRRQGRPAHVEAWRVLADGSAALCVVADDRPGFLSAVAAALVSHRLDVITALVFLRPVPGHATEALDLVWVRRANEGDKAPIDDDEVASVGQVLSAILAGSISMEQIASRALASDPPDDAHLVVRFDESDPVGLAALLVEAADRPGILLTIAFEVFQHGGQIVRSLVRTAGGRAFNHFELAEFSGAPLSTERCEEIRAAVYAALSLRDNRVANAR
jgi:UTP:GlnB (protein PII) uridylyltransferase